MKRGELVTDGLVILMVAERSACLRCRGGFLLDGFPRTETQAQALDGLLDQQGVALDAVLSYELPIEAIVHRLAGRRTCGQCKAVYHLTGHPPNVEGVCDQCRAFLVQRDDDRPASIRIRMKAYEDSTRPLANYYTTQGKLIRIDASGEPAAILARSIELLKARLATVPSIQG
jgi:adenylate kinase